VIAIVRSPLLAFALLACAPTLAPTAPVVHAQADAPLPGPCSTTEDGPSGRVVVAYEYDVRRRLVREVEHGATRQVQRLWSYDDAGRRARQIVVEGDRLRAIWYVYDDRGLLVRTEDDATGKRDVVLRHDRNYDDRGKLVRLATTRPDGEVLREQALHYDNAGRLAWETVVRGPDTDRIAIDLDPAGRIVARRSKREAQRFAYAMTGRLASMTVERNGRPHLERRYAYDSAGNLMHVQTRDAAGRPLRTTIHSYACWAR
jgi:hypothetical protein